MALAFRNLCSEYFAVIHWKTSCHKNRMTINVIILWPIQVTSFTMSVSTMHFLLEILSILKAVNPILNFI